MLAADSDRIVRSAPGRGRVLAALAAAAFVGIAGLWAYRTWTALDEPGDPMLWTMRDFRDGIYYPVVAWLDGVNPYSPSDFLGAYPAVAQLFPIVSPGVLLLNLPYATLSFAHARIAYFLFSLLLLLAYAPLLLAAGGVRVTAARALWLAVFLVASRPVYSALTLGQGILPVAIGVTAALHFATRKPRLGGVGLAFAFLKPTFGVPLALLMLARREYRAVLIGVATAAGMAAIPLVTIVAGTGVDGFVSDIGENLRLWDSHPSVGLSGDDIGRFDAAVALVRILGLRLAEATSLPVALAIVGVAAYALSMSASSRRHGKSAAATGRPRTVPHTSHIVALLAVLLAVYHQRYDAVVLAGPIVALYGRQVDVPEGIRRLALVLLLGVWFNYVSTTTGVRVLALEPWSWTWRIVASMNSLALLVVFFAFVGTVVARRGKPAEGND